MPTQNLVGVNGSPLQVHRQVKVKVEVQGEVFQMDALVVSPLTAEAILGLDFLRKYEVVIDIQQKQLTFGKGGSTLPLAQTVPPSTARPTVQAVATIKIPPYSEMEAMACLPQPVQTGTWLV